MEKNNKYLLWGLIIWVAGFILYFFPRYLDLTHLLDSWGFYWWIMVLGNGCIFGGGFLTFYGIFNRITIKNKTLKSFVVYILSFVVGILGQLWLLRALF
jgi:hypothetical protein